MAKAIILLFFLYFFSMLLSSIHSSTALSLPLNQASGPESIAFDCKGRGPYVGVSDGRILRWEGSNRGWMQFAVTSRNRDDHTCNGSNNPSLEPYCGRPLGLQFNKDTCDLYIADSSFGLLVVGPNGGVATQLVTMAEETPIIFANGLDIDQKTGIIYFTDTSTKFHRSEYLEAILSGDKTGRLIKYDPSTRMVTVLLQDIAFANGVAVSHDGTFVLVTETSTGRVLRYWLQGPKAATSDVFIQLPGQPDNIKRNTRGKFWVSVNPFEAGPRVMPPPQMMSITHSQAMKLDENGSVMEVFVGNDGSRLESTSEVNENGGNLWIGSIVSSHVGVYRV